MFDSNNITSVSPTQPAIVTNRTITEFPVQAKITNADIAFFTDGCNRYDSRTVQNGEIVTLTKKRAYTVFEFVTAAGVQGFIFARGIEVVEVK